MASELHASSHFFVVEQALGSSHDTTFERLGDNMGEAPLCPQCGRTVGMLTWLPPYRGKLELHGQDFGDFVEGPGNSALISQRLADAFRAERLTGLSGFHPVELVRARKHRRNSAAAEVPGYLHVLPAYGGAAVDEARSRIRRSGLINCTLCLATGVQAIHGFALEPGSWRGEDLFRPRGLHGRLVASMRFARFVTEHGFTNMLLTPTEEYVWDPLELGPVSSPSAGQA
jgi:hypothetical protein